MRRLLIFALFVVCPILLASSLAVAAEGGPSTPESLEAKVIDFVGHRPIDSVPYGEMEAFGPEAVPILRRLLDDPNYESSHGQVLTMLGVLGDASDFLRMRHYVMEGHSGDISDDQLGSIFAALFALGSLSDKEPQALAFLRECANPHKFDGLPYRSPSRTDEYFRLLLSKIAINGIGLSARPEAASVLEDLKARPYHNKQVANINDSIERHRAIAKVGRAHYAEELRRERAGKEKQ